MFRSTTRDGESSLAARVAIGPGAVTVTVTVAVGVAELATEDELPPGVLYDPA